VFALLVPSLLASGQRLVNNLLQSCRAQLADLLQVIPITCYRPAIQQFVASLSTSCNNAVILSSCYKFVAHNLSTRYVRNRFVASLSTSCNNAVILSSCYKFVTHNLLTRCVRNRFVASLSTSCNIAVILSICYKVVTHNLFTSLLRTHLVDKL
jgi:pyruvate/2-oxoacid:ferredoxin oxidoreductase beta subunit